MTANDGASEYSSVLLEEMRESFRAVMEAVGDIQRHVQALPEIKQNTRLLMDDNQALKVAVRELSNEIGGLISHLISTVMNAPGPKESCDASTDEQSSKLP
jgi:hypothetical protein